MRDGAEYFTQPVPSAQRRYEAMRAYFVDDMPAAQVADRFGYSTASVHQMATLLRGGRMEFFAAAKPGPKGPRRPGQGHHPLALIVASRHPPALRPCRTVPTPAGDRQPRPTRPDPRRRLSRHPGPVGVAVDRHPAAGQVRPPGPYPPHRRSHRRHRPGPGPEPDRPAQGQPPTHLRLPGPPGLQPNTAVGAVNALRRQGLATGEAGFNCDFHAIRHHGEVVPPKVLSELAALPASAWTTHRIDRAGHYRHPQIHEQVLAIKGIDNRVRQIAVRNIGRDEPTLIITNALTTPAKDLFARYAERMTIENELDAYISGFHLDALTSGLPLNVDLDTTLTVVAGNLYRILARTLPRYETATPDKIWRHFLDATGTLNVTNDAITVNLNLRTYHPVLIDAGFADLDLPIPWLNNRHLRFGFPPR